MVPWVDPNGTLLNAAKNQNFRFRTTPVPIILFPNSTGVTVPLP